MRGYCHRSSGVLTAAKSGDKGEGREIGWLKGRRLGEWGRQYRVKWGIREEKNWICGLRCMGGVGEMECSKASTRFF